MIAKIIVHGRDRAEAIARMRRALEMTVIEGIKTTIPLHLKILNDPDFVAGRLSTHFMERFMPPARPSSPGGIRLSRVPAACPPLYAIVRRRRVRAPPGRRAARRSPRRSCDGGARLLQIRAKHAAGARSRWRSPRPSMATPAPPARTLIVNDRVDIARDGAAAACTSARTICRRRTRGACSVRTPLVGCSTHTPAAARRGARRADRPTSPIGPVFATATKANPDPVVGLERLRARGRQAAGGRRAARRDRRHHAGDGAGGDRRRGAPPSP